MPKGPSPITTIPTKACRPFDKDRNGIVVAEGGGLCSLERLPDALARGAKIYGEIVGYAMNSDAVDFVLPDRRRQAECIRLALARAGLKPADIDIVSSHATATQQGDIEEVRGLREVFGTVRGWRSTTRKVLSATRWGRPGRLELFGNLPRLTMESHTLQSTSKQSTPSATCRRSWGICPRHRQGEMHLEQLVRHAGDQLGRHRQEVRGE